MNARGSWRRCFGPRGTEDDRDRLGRPPGAAAGDRHHPNRRAPRACAFLFASSHLWTALAGGNDSEVDDRSLTAGVALYEAAFGADSHRRYDSPTLVEAEARGHEVAAELLETLTADALAHRATAKRMRDAGTVDVPFGEETAPT
jgi:hypothetical protein